MFLRGKLFQLQKNIKKSNFNCQKNYFNYENNLNSTETTLAMLTIIRKAKLIFFINQNS